MPAEKKLRTRYVHPRRKGSKQFKRSAEEENEYYEAVKKGTRRYGGRRTRRHTRRR